MDSWGESDVPHRKVVDSGGAVQAGALRRSTAVERHCFDTVRPSPVELGHSRPGGLRRTTHSA